MFHEPTPNPPLLPLPHALSQPASTRSRSYALLRPPNAYTFLARPASPGGFRNGSIPFFSPLDLSGASFLLFPSLQPFFAGRLCVLLVSACNSLRCRTRRRACLSCNFATPREENSRASRRTASENLSDLSRLLTICCSLRRGTESSVCTLRNSSHGLVAAGSAEATASAALWRTVPLLLGAAAPHRPRAGLPTRRRDSVHSRLDEHSLSS